MNYYLHTKPPCECCKRPYAPLHIGKSSAGWCFALHVIPEEGIKDLEDWRVLWSQPGSWIEDEYGDSVSADTIEDIITERVTEQHFHRKNHSRRGPNGLLRLPIGNGCVKHGDGTWDYIEGDFS